MITICGFSFELPTLLAEDKDYYAKLEREFEMDALDKDRRRLIAKMKQLPASVKKHQQLVARAWRLLEQALDADKDVDKAESYYDAALAKLNDAEQAQEVSFFEDGNANNDLTQKANLFYLAFIHYLATKYAECSDELSDWNLKAENEDYAAAYRVIEKKYLLKSALQHSKLLMDSGASNLAKSA